MKMLVKYFLLWVVIWALVFFLCYTATAAPPFDYSRSTPTRYGNTYYGYNGAVVGRSYNTRSGTNWYYNNQYYGRSYQTSKGNEYFFKTGKK